jgi:hypothetical protein
MFSTADLLSNLLIRIAYVKLKGINGKIEFKFQFICIIMFLLTKYFQLIIYIVWTLV